MWGKPRQNYVTRARGEISPRTPRARPNKNPISSNPINFRQKLTETSQFVPSYCHHVATKLTNTIVPHNHVSLSSTRLCVIVCSHHIALNPYYGVNDQSLLNGLTSIHSASLGVIAHASS